MGLYLTIFEGEIEVDGVEVGLYEDFGVLRDAVATHLEEGAAGSRFPTLMLHSDCDGEWSPNEAASLGRELEIVSGAFRNLPPIPLNSEWKKEIAKMFRLKIESLYDCFFDVDGEPLLERLASLARLSQAKTRPILFQ